MPYKFLYKSRFNSKGVFVICSLGFFIKSPSFYHTIALPTELLSHNIIKWERQDSNLRPIVLHRCYLLLMTLFQTTIFNIYSVFYSCSLWSCFGYCYPNFYFLSLLADKSIITRALLSAA